MAVEQGPPRFPNDSQHMFVTGRNGTGKTVASVWHLSRRSWDVRPWVIIDAKADKLIADIPGLEEIGAGDKIPEYPGLYVVRPQPDEDEAVDQTLWNAWQMTHCGVYVDEAYFIKESSKPFNAILRTGRSREVPLIALSQRPKRVPRALISESTMFQVYDLNDKRDQDTLAEFTTISQSDFDTLGLYESMYYDVGRNAKRKLPPVETEDLILQRFEDRQPKKPKRKFLGLW